MRFCISALLCTLLVTISLANAAKVRSNEQLLGSCKQIEGQAPRVRKEIRDLTEYEREALFEALWTMRNLTTEEGLERYGGNFRNWDHYVVKHATAAKSPEGDQGHFGPCFMTFHRLLLLEIERTLLSIRPEFKALPYWNMAYDSAIGGRYSVDHEDSIFSSKFFGSYTGDPDEGYAVTDGAFAYWPVTSFNGTRYAQYSSIFNGSDITGLNRGYNNPTNVSYVARFDKIGPTPDPLMLLEANTDICANYTFVQTWEEWQNCIEIVRDSIGSNPPVGVYYIEGRKAPVPWFHSQAHVKIGSMQPATGFMGDFRDVATSINDPLFIFHHANVDRNNMKWQLDAQRRNNTMAGSDVLWGFPTILPVSKTSTTGFDINAGCWLRNSDVSKHFPFLPFEVYGEGADEACPGSGTDGIYTHEDILRFSKPGESTYIYDKCKLKRRD